MRTSLETVWRAAFRVREELELHPREIDRELLTELYKSYNPAIPDAAQFVNAAIDAFPHGACGLASAYNKHLLGGLGEVIHGSYLVNGEPIGHTVLYIAELAIISCVTSDQFNGEKLYVGPLQEPWRL